MKLLATILLFTTLAAGAQDGYEIKVTLKPIKNQYVYLGHYYGKQLPIIDSVKLNEKSEGVLRGKKKLGGGIYLVGYPDRSRNFEILVDKNQKFSIVADTANIRKVSFINSPENVTFKAYQEFMMKKGQAIDSIRKSGNSPSAMEAMKKINAEVVKYRTDIMTKQPASLMTLLLKGMREPEVPQNAPEAKTDTLFAYKYFKKHYWDGVNFWDDRIARTPFFEARLDKYFEQLVYPSADSVIKEMDWMLGYAAASADMQKFLLLKFVNRYLTQKYMWEDAVMVHLFTKYFAQQDYPWLTEKGKKMIADRAYSLMANIFGSPAPEVELPAVSGKKTNLYGIEAPFVLVAIWDPKCGHCKETLPRIDSMYAAKWKGLGLKIFALAKETDGTKSDWTGFIESNKLQDWVHVYYSKADEQARVNANLPGYSQLYDVQSFPTLYLLDKDKRIIAKKLTFEQIDEVLAQKIKTTD
jgi:thiol-disulfide isomerase/thioredoxin